MKKTLLIPGKQKRPTVFQKEIAVVLGLNHAIVLQQLDYWVQVNREKNHNFRNGFYWVYNTYQELHDQLPFLSVATIKRTITDLEKQGLLIVGNFNRLKYDRTKWYRIDKEKLYKVVEERVQNEPYEQDNLTPPIPNNKTKTNKENKDNNGIVKKDNKPKTIIKEPIVREKTITTFIDSYMNDFYKQKYGKKHPTLKHDQYVNVYDNLHFFAMEHLGLNEEKFGFNQNVYDDLVAMAIKFFNEFPKGQTDWNINHFSDQSILLNRFYELT